MNLQEIVRERLRSLGISTRQAEDAGGLPFNYIHDLVKGKKQSVKAEQLGAIARAIGLRIADLIDEGDDSAFCAHYDPDFSEDAAAILTLLAPEALEKASFRVDRPVPSLSLVPGDLLICDKRGSLDDHGLFLASKRLGGETRRYLLGSLNQNFISPSLDPSKPLFVGSSSLLRIDARVECVLRLSQGS